MSISLNKGVADGYYAALCQMRDTYGLRDDISVSLLSRFQDVFLVEKSPEDLEAVAEIERRSIPDPWSRKGFAEALGRPEVLFLVAEKEAERRKIAGYCVLYTAADEGEIPTIAVDAGSRRRGIAAKLLRAVFAGAKERGVKRIYLEARQSNAGALALYSSCGFVVDGKRPGFYSNPTEDAVLLHRELAAAEGAADVLTDR